MTRSLWCALLCLFVLLSACSLKTIEADVGGDLTFGICERALEQPTNKRAFQGYDGWFFFDLDFNVTYPLLERAPFIVELSERLKAHGVTLVVLPISSRAVVRPDVLYFEDPVQSAFDPQEAGLRYETFVQDLRTAGVLTIDALATAQAFDAEGGQTFFKRDLHWTPEGANAIFKETAAQVASTFGDTLPEAPFQVTRNPQDAGHRGQFVNNWTSENCGYLLPPEPLGRYSVTHVNPASGSGTPEVVLVGSSFSIEPYSYDFLAAALKTNVLNASVGAGGAIKALRKYILEGSYRTSKPRVLVWEFPTYAPDIGPEQQQELLQGIDQL